MKKVTLFALALALVLSLAACGASASAGPEGSDVIPSSSTAGDPEGSETPAPSSAPEPASAPAEEPTPEPTEEPAAESEQAAPSGNSAAIITDDGPSATAADQTNIRGGSNQNDAILLPLETKLYGTVSDGGIQWFAFKTDDTENATYAFTTINKTVGTHDLSSAIFDEYGNQLNKWRQAGNSGTPDTYQTSELEPNTVYYLRVEAYNRYQDTIHYMLRIRNMTAQAAGYQTAGSMNEAVGLTAALEGNIAPGTNLDDAAYIPLDAKIGGTVTDGIISWFAFKTDDTENATYLFTTVNESAGTHDLSSAIFDEYGNQLNKWRQAGNSGTPDTYQTSELEPNTVYYLRVEAYNRYQDTIHYTLRITPPEKPKTNTAAVTAAEEPLVFETPFELNSTQVMFVANKAEFLDEAAAKAALAPVAEIILAHPDHPILLAGTTATEGAQESCVVLSNKRAEAVKDLLVSAFGVPEDQLQTIGLGYEADPFVRGKDRAADGSFVESEGAKNRRVVVMDANDAIAQELLNP